MKLKTSDLKAYDAFVAARGKRSDMGREFVTSMIDCLDARIAASDARRKAHPKVKHYRAERARFAAILRVMEAIDG